VSDLVSAETVATSSSKGAGPVLETWALWRAWYERQRAEETEATAIPAAPCECPPRGEEPANARPRPAATPNLVL
jgi:hypothetical protein